MGILGHLRLHPDNRRCAQCRDAVKKRGRASGMRRCPLHAPVPTLHRRGEQLSGGLRHLRLHRPDQRPSLRRRLQQQRRGLPDIAAQLPGGLRRLQLHHHDHRQRIRWRLQQRWRFLPRLSGQLYSVVWRKLAEYPNRDEAWSVGVFRHRVAEKILSVGNGDPQERLRGGMQ